MNGAQPTGDDFTFQHLGMYYAIGYSELDESYALSRNTAGNWSWELVESAIDNTEIVRRWGTYDVFLAWFIEKVNKKVFGGTTDLEPQDELGKLLNATKNGLEYTPTGIIIK